MTVAAVTAAVAAAREHRGRHGAGILGEFASLLAMPNVARDLAGVRSNAAAIVAAFAERGVNLERVERDDAAPLLIGRIPGRGDGGTVGIYVHYDGQPVDPDEWSSPPFQPTLLTRSRLNGGTIVPFPAAGDLIDPEWRLYARSAADDKAPLVALLAALDAYAAVGLIPVPDVLLAFEGEEEIGSPHLPGYFAADAGRLAADLWLICDGPVHHTGVPQVVFGVRGISEMEITVYGPNRDLHSGHYGNWAPNPAQLLAGLLASMKSEAGEITVDGFYDGTMPISSGDLAALDALPTTDAELQHELGLGRVEGDGESSIARVMLPSLNLRGLSAGDVGTEARNVVPAEATASIDVRLAPGNDPAEMLDRIERHVVAEGYHVTTDEPTADERLGHQRLARIRKMPGYPGARFPSDTPQAQAILAAAAAAAPEGEVIAMPTFGGSVPVHAFTETLGLPVAILPMANHDNNQHAADENLRVGNLWYGVDLMAAVLATPIPALER